MGILIKILIQNNIIFKNNFIFIFRYVNRPVLYTIDIGITSRLNKNSWSLTDLKVSKIFINPDYSDKLLKNDIALIKLRVIFISIIL